MKGAKFCDKFVHPYLPAYFKLVAFIDKANRHKKQKVSSTHW